jgi:intracellular multiplication protein IcmB
MPEEYLMSITGLFSNLTSAVNSLSKKSLSSFCFWETSNGNEILVAKDGSLGTVIRIDGIKQVMGEEELNRAIHGLNRSLGVYLGEEGHAIQVWFARDKDLSPQLIKDHMRGNRDVASRQSLSFEDIFDEAEAHLPKYITWEGFYVVLWTRLSILTKKERENARLELKPPAMMPSVSDAQDPFRVGQKLTQTHMSFVTSFIGDLKQQSIRASALNVHEAIKAMRNSVYPDLIGSDWKATMPGDPLRVRVPEINNFDASHVLWPRIDEQIFSREAEVVNPRITKLGSKLFACMDMVIGPMETLSFDALLNRMIESGEFPWRVSFLIEGGGLKTLGIKKFLASIFQMTNGDNKMIRQAIEALQEDQQENTTVTKLRISFATWADAGLPDSLKTIEERGARLQRAAENWGNCVVSPLVGDPVEGVMSSALGLDMASTAPAGAVPLPDVVKMLPLNRDASPWKTGPVLWRTVDGRPWPYWPGSSLQDTFIDLVFAPPGKGKSVWMNTVNLARCLSPVTLQAGGAQLPRIAIIDVGPSSAGLISLLQEALPPSLRHKVAYHRLRMTPEYAINPFDTQLCCRKPLPLERAFLVNFLTALATDIGETKPPGGLAQLMGAAVEALYDRYSDLEMTGTPLRYNEGVAPEVDKAIKAYNLPIDVNETKWWDIVDAFFERGDIHYATLAQRHAVPRLEHMMTILKEPQVVDVYGTAKHNDELVVEIATRMISSSLREYPILARPTVFDIGDSRVVALDLDEIAPKGGGPADKQTALMYMLARFVQAKDFYLGPDLLPLIPEKYHSFHGPRLKKMKETPKYLVYDEFHRTSKASAVREQVVVDMREGRKWGVHICLASQLLDDFDKEMASMASGIWVMGVNNERDVKDTTDMFGLSATAEDIIRNDLTGPTKEGAPFLGILNLKEGRHEHHLVNTIGPTLVWALSTTAEDQALRNRLYEIEGAVRARKILARRFPSGTAKAEIEARASRVESRHRRSDRDVQAGVIEQLVQELAGSEKDR